MSFFAGSTYSESANGDLVPENALSLLFGVNTQFLGTTSLTDVDTAIIDVKETGEINSHERAPAPGSTVQISLSAPNVFYFDFYIYDSSGNQLFHQSKSDFSSTANFTVSTSLVVPDTDYLLYQMNGFDAGSGAVGYSLTVNGTPDATPIDPGNLISTVQSITQDTQRIFDANKIAVKLGKLAGDVPSGSFADLLEQNLKFTALAADAADSDFFDWTAKGFAKDLDESQVNTRLGHLGNFLDVVSAAYTAHKTYKETGNLQQAVTDGGIKLIAALVSGKAGQVVGLGAAGLVASVTGTSLLLGTGLPILVGLGVGFATTQVVDLGVQYLLKESAKYAYGDSQQMQLALAAVETQSEISVGEQLPSPKWQFNLQTGEFEWLDDSLANDFEAIATQLEIHPTPKSLSITGDQFANSKNDFLSGQGANDSIRGALGNDVIAGEGGHDSLFGDAGRDILFGQGGNDRLVGGEGDDALIGGEGNDVLLGGAGFDTLSGGLGKDIFDFNSIKETKKGGKRDKIMDFKRGQDDIDLSTIDATKGGSGHKFKWIGKQDFHDKKGELRYIDKGSSCIVQGDVNGDGKADFEIFVKVGSLGKGDFLL